MHTTISKTLKAFFSDLAGVLLHAGCRADHDCDLLFFGEDWHHIDFHILNSIAGIHIVDDVLYNICRQIKYIKYHPELGIIHRCRETSWYRNRNDCQNML